MKKIWKRSVALLLTVMMLFSLVACGKQGQNGLDDTESKDLSWLNTEGELPIVKEGTEKTLKVAIQVNSNVSDVESLWFYQFIENEMNINLEVTKLSAGSEQLTLLFADGDLPDVIIGAGVSPETLVRYGADENMLADLAPYITEELTPNLYKLYSEHPEYKDAVEDKDGHIWSLGYVNSVKGATIPRVFINYDWLEDAGLSTPATLDEFVNMLRAFKKRGSDITPVGGSWSNENPLLIFLNAFGYITENAQGTDIALRNGEVVLPVADREAYGEYLKLLRQLYEEGLIHKNFFSLSFADLKTMYANNQCGYLATAPFQYISSFTSWWGAQALTSDYNSTAQWPQGTDSGLTCGGLVISAESENIELAMRFADWFYEESGVNYVMASNGPASTQTEYIYDESVPGYEINEETFTFYYPGYIRNQNKYASLANYTAQNIYLLPYGTIGRISNDTYVTRATEFFKYTEEEVRAAYTDLSAEGIQAEARKEYAMDGDKAFRAALEDTMLPYITDEALPIAYLDAETVSRLANCWTLVKEYAAQETANFVVGRRELTDEELDKYFDEIEALGATEIIEAYRAYYEE